MLAHVLTDSVILSSAKDLDHMENMVLRIAGLIALFKTARVGNGLQSCSTFIVDQTG